MREEAVGKRGVPSPRRNKRERPRDHLGRPQPWGAPNTLVLEDFDALPLEENHRLGCEHLAAGRYFPAHEAWETAWKQARGTADAELWLDGGHNPHAARALADALAQRQAKAPRPLALIVGMLGNKDAGGFFDAFKDSGAHVFTVPFEGAAAEPEALAAVARGHGLGATPMTSVQEALSRTLALGAGRVVICGSLYLAGEVLAASRETWPD